MAMPVATPFPAAARAPAPRGRPLRVGLHVGQLVQPVPGGIGRVVETLSEALPGLGADVVCFAACSRRERLDLATRVGPAALRCFGTLPQTWQYQRWQHTRRPVLHLGCDVCHAPSLAIPTTDAPLAVTVNDVAFLRHPDAFTRHGLHFHERGLEIARRSADAIIVPSEHTRTELVREGFDARRVHRVPLAVAPIAARDPNETTAVLRHAGVTEPYVLVVGTIEPRKGHAVVLRAVPAAAARPPRTHARRRRAVRVARS